MLWLFPYLLSLVVLTTHKVVAAPHIRDMVIANGQMPSLAKNPSGTLHLVYGSGDSLMYTFSKDNAVSFAPPYLVARVPGLASAHTRGRR